MLNVESTNLGTLKYAFFSITNSNLVDYGTRRVKVPLTITQ
jgi:hypothetical protein